MISKVGGMLIEKTTDLQRRICYDMDKVWINFLIKAAYWNLIISNPFIIVIVFTTLLFSYLCIFSFSIYLDDLSGQVFTLFILTVAAAEAAIGLAIIVIYYRNRGSIRVEDIHEMKG